ncbi:MAG: hypothetical protein V1851_00455 [Patescibacteria group bacterium]
MKNLNKFFVSFMAIVVFLPTLVFGATMQFGEDIYIQKEKALQDNLYLAGGAVSVNNPILGDLFITGGQIVVSEEVSGDIFIMGGSITILGNVKGDVRVVGGNVLLTGNIAGDLIMAGGTMNVSSGASIGKDLVAAGGHVSIDGKVLGNTKIAGGIVTINGQLLGNLKARIEEKLIIGSGAVVKGILEYSARDIKILNVSDEASLSNEIIFNKIGGEASNQRITKGFNNFIFAFLGVFVLFKLVASILLAVILTWLFKKFSNSVVTKAIQNPLNMLGEGFVVLVVVPIASILLFITLLGIPLGIMAILSYSLILAIAGIYSGVVFAAWIFRLIRKDNKVIISWKNIIGGVILLALIVLIPYIGWIIGLIVFLITFGSIADMVYEKLWKER